MKNFGDFTAGYYDVKDQLPHFLRTKAESLINSEEKEKKDIKTVKSFEKRRSKLRKIFIESIGGLPAEKTPLKPQITGRIEKANYFIEKVIFESQPKFYVTANLYIPKNLKGKAPAVLFVCGHSIEAKAYPGYQKVAIDLVNNGFIVLSIDPPGQGERMQYYNKKNKTTDIKWGTTEHSYTGFQCILNGAGIARYFIWDGMRGIDYLFSRPEVDGERIGVTGNSGGGLQTAYLTFLDDRIKCSVPCSYVTSRLDYMKTGQPHDAEQNVFGIIKTGINYDDLITGIAPQPVQLGVNAYDFFCVEGAVKSLEKAKNIYGLYRAKNNIRMEVGSTTHQYSDQLRQAAVNTFRKYLRNEKSDFVTDINMKTEEPAVLNCIPAGQILESYPEAETVYTLNRKYTDSVFPSRVPAQNKKALEKNIKKIRAKLIKLLPYQNAGEKIYPRIISKDLLPELDCEKENIFFFSEPDITVTGFLFKPLKAKGALKSYILVAEEGTAGFRQQKKLLKTLLRKGFAVFLFDPRGVGGVLNRNVTQPYGNSAIFDAEYKINYDAMMLGTSITALRVFDIIRAYDYLATREDLDKKKIGLIGSRAAGIWALFAGVLEPRLSKVVLSETLYSYKNLIDTRLFSYDNKILLHGVLRNFDLVDLVACYHGRKISFLKMQNAKGCSVNAKLLESEFMPVLNTFYGAGKYNKTVNFRDVELPAFKDF